MASNYIVPQVLVFQEFTLVPTSTLRPLPAHIAGPHAFLRRYSDSDEQAQINVGYYDESDDQTYDWPDRPAGATVDASYTKVFIKDALLKYFDDPLSAGSAITRVSGYNNRIRSATISFKDNGEVDANGDYEYPKSASMGDRGVKVGDVAHVRRGDDELWTYVNGFVGETVASTVASASADSGNESTQAASASVEFIEGTENCVSAENPTAHAYNGLVTGDTDEVYTIVVTESSVGGDFTTAKLRITSASGNDDVEETTPSAGGVPTAIGTRGAYLIFDYDECDSEELGDEVSAMDLIEGQTWELTVHQAFTAPTGTSGGTYTGTKDCTYIVEVTKGGLYTDTDKPEITVTTDIGNDVSGPTDVTAAATAIAVGSEGVTISFTGTGLRKGDKWTIAVEAEAEGALQTLILGNNLPAGITAGQEVSLELYIRKDLQVTENRVSAPPLVNWEQSDTEIEIKSGLEAYADDWTVDDELVALPVFSAEDAEYGKVYVEYRAWLATHCNEIGSVSDVSELDDAIAGELHPDNPLKWGVFKALSNSNGQAVKFTSVCDPDDVDSWTNVLELLDGSDDVYGLVPLTRNSTVMDLYAAHVDAQSAPEYGRWRVCWLNLEDVTTKRIVSEVTSDDGEVVLAVLEDDPDEDETQYTLLRVPGANSNFITNGVRATDVVRFLYTTDGFGAESYTEFTVDEVLSEEEIRLQTGHSVAIGTPQKVEIWRNLSKTERAAEIATQAGSYASRRVRAVWPDLLQSGGVSQQGYHLCAALAGLASGVVSHQSLTNLEIAGFDDVSRTTDLFNRTQLNTMAGAGAWIVTQDPTTGRVYTRHGVTTGSTDDVNQREEMIVRNVDAISYLFRDRFAPYIGISNVTPEFLEVVRVETDSLITFLRGNNFIRRLGSQLIDGEIVELREHTLLRDRIVLAVDLTVPVAANTIEVHLVV